MNSKTFMQAEITNAFIKRHKLTMREFLSMEKKYKILDFIEEGYEPFHLMGTEGILKEVESLLPSPLAFS